MPSPTVVLLILLGVVSAALAGSGWYITELLEDKGKLTVLYDAANRETDKQKNITANLRVEIAREQTALTLMGVERGKDNVEFQKKINKLNSTLESSRKASVKYPERYGPVVTYQWRRGMRTACRAGRGSTGTCKTDSVQSGKTKPNPASKPNTSPNYELDNTASN